ncbi:uncharacterized protein L201_007892 [Kwoniella dendrophila CBS 6074]|uniref:P-loop containing nucleoside triphosphate hydrolase protein n=1 Tax=Kwoniella dendrophila CBS 6074 TaxID=1295534 RepID=A0AAX4K731_9TREE
MSIPFWRPKPYPPEIFEDQPIPWSDANIFSKLFLEWITPTVKAAWSRDIKVDDLYDLTPDLQSKLLGDELETNFMKREPPSVRSRKYKAKMDNGATGRSADSANSERTPLLSNGSQVGARYDGHQQNTFQGKHAIIENDRKYDQSLFKAIYFTVRKQWWSLIFIKLVAIGIRTCLPLVMKILIEQISLSHKWHQAIKSGKSTNALTPPKSLEYMISVGVGMWIMHMVAMVLLMYNFWRGRLIGRRITSALTAMISRKAKRLSGKSRLEMTNGRITNMVSVDQAFILRTAQQSNEIVCLPVQVGASTVILVWQLGYSAYVGLAVILLTGPLKVWMFKYISALQKSQNEIIDQRVKLLSEILINIRAVKLYAYESWFGQKISGMRKNEMTKFQQNNLVKSTMSSLMNFLPTLAAIATFITYATMGHKLNAAIIFSSLQFYSNIRTPISILPDNLTDLSRAWVGLNRIGDLLRAEELDSDIDINTEYDYAIDVNADFRFETAAPEVAKGKAKDTNDNNQTKTSIKVDNKGLRNAIFFGAKLNNSAVSSDDAPEGDQNTFRLTDIDIKIPKGSLVCIVGRIGTGKTALLSGLINEMKRTKGYVRFGGTVSYVPQQAWIQSGTIRENITFSVAPENVDLERVETIIDACALRRDIEGLSYGDLTKIGERGITLSGGQRQRICIARAAYENSDIVLLDDPLSAVDANVGHHLLENCLFNGPMSDRTRILVTHHFDVLPKADLILVMDRDILGNGRIIQKGTFEKLMQEEGTFKALFTQYGTPRSQAQPLDAEETPSDTERSIESPIDHSDKKDKMTKESNKLILDEDKAEGVVESAVYFNYMKSIRSPFLLVICVVMMVLAQVATVINSLFLGYWSENHFKGLSQSAYMGIYNGLGIAMAIFTWNATFFMNWAGIRASYDMFSRAWKGVMRSPTSWHDRTPTGRIINRLSKDVEILDQDIASIWHKVLRSALGVIGSFGLILCTYPQATFVFLPILAYDFLYIRLFRQSTRELNRLLPILRSDVYTNLGEQLTGLPIIRVFKQQELFERKMEQSVDAHMSAVIMGGFTQGAWLGIRLSVANNLLVLTVVIFGIVYRKSISAAEFGVVLNYIIIVGSSMNGLVVDAVFAEQLMNTVERVQYYTELPSEETSNNSSDPGPGDSWPNQGRISFKNVDCDIDLSAGKSSIIQALFRTVEVRGGNIEIDGIDLRSLGLDTLRQRLSIIPQDAFLFSGTIRENIDPTGSYSDDRLNDALNLIYRDSDGSSSVLRDKFRLDALLTSEGSNFSAGEKQLLALIRALVKRSKILLLDEATSSVDPETDALIQRIIQTEFSDITLISIAHRLQTVAYYDRILVIDEGQMAEFDEPLKLFDRPDSIFKNLCMKKNISKSELLRISKGAKSSGN